MVLYKFDPIIQIREREKQQALKVFNESVKNFEEVAGKLYELLKKKEDLASYQAEKLSHGLPVQEIRHFQQFFHNIEKSIQHYQSMVLNARNRMNYLQEQLLEKNIEVKKFSKMKEITLGKFAQENKILEAKQMDEISLQQYLNREM